MQSDRDYDIKGLDLSDDHYTVEQGFVRNKGPSIAPATPFSRANRRC